MIITRQNAFTPVEIQEDLIITTLSKATFPNLEKVVSRHVVHDIYNQDHKNIYHQDHRNIYNQETQALDLILRDKIFYYHQL